MHSKVQPRFAVECLHSAEMARQLSGAAAGDAKRRDDFTTLASCRIALGAPVSE